MEVFEKLEDTERRFAELQAELSEPTVTNDTARFRKLMKEQNDLSEVVGAYREYKQAKKNIEDSLAMLDTESDE